MKRFLNIISVIIAALSLASCRGAGGDALELVFKADKLKISADGRTAVTFSVYEGLENVTASARIRNITAGKWLDGNVFTSRIAGKYEFAAEYGGREAEETIIVEVEPLVESAFVRNVCLMEFTDASCTFCPDASRYIDRNILKKMDNVHLMAFHEKDQWKSSCFYTLFDRFRKDSDDKVCYTGTPAVVVDMRSGCSLEQGNREAVDNQIKVSLKEYPAHCGVSVASVRDLSQKVRVTVRIKSEKTSDYYMALYVVEDGIIGYQKDGSLEFDNYYHQFVKRQLLSKTVYGDALGTVESGAEKVVEYSVDIDPEWNLDKTYAYALALDADGYVNNMQTCLLDGGNADYEYINNK